MTIDVILTALASFWLGYATSGVVRDLRRIAWLNQDINRMKQELDRRESSK